MPAIQARFNQYSPDLVVLAVDNDESQEIVSPFVDELGLTFSILLDPGAAIQGLYQIRGYPSSYFVDANGIIQVVHIGIMTEGQLDGYLAEVGIGDG
jgi:peroxiredoxin